MQRLFGHGRGGFHERLGEGRVAVNGAGDVFGAGAELERQHGLGDHLGRARADDVHAQDAVGPLVGDELDEALGLTQAAGAGGAGKRVGAGGVRDAALL